ncbi:MAG: FitA-like ribbon-helix-helix domain-containing protein [Pseudonocardiales bacterium]
MLQIRNVPEETRRALKARAAARGESLNAYLLELLNRDVARPTIGEVLDRAARRAERADVSALDIVAAGRAEREDQLHGRFGR